MNIKVISLLILIFCVTLTQQKLYQCDPNASCGCSQKVASVNARIIDGEIASDQTWSWAVSLKIGNNICGGSIISDSYIITAGHCVVNKNIYQITAYFGSTRLHSGFTRQVSYIYLHPQYYQSLGGRYILHDIALLKLSTPLDMTNKMLAMVCLPKGNIIFTNNTDLIAVGWGTTYEGSQSASQTLRQVTLNVIDPTNALCTSVAHDRNIHICAGIMPFGGKDTCQGDSGGPLMRFHDGKQWELYGITSYGNGCGRPRSPGVYTRVGYYLDWMNQIMKNEPTTTTSTAYNPSTRTYSTSGVTDNRLNFFFIYFIVLIIFI